MNIKKRQLIRDSVIYTFLPKISFLASLFVTPLISKELTLRDFGIYGLITSFTAIFQILIIVGQNIVIQNAFFEYKANYKLVWKRCFGVMYYAAVISAVLFCLVAYFFLKKETGNHLFLVLGLVSIYIILSPIDTIAVNYFVLHQRPLMYSLGALFMGLFTVVINLITIKYYHLGYLGWIIAMPLGYVVLYLVYARDIFIKEKILPVFRIKKKFVLNSLHVGGPMVPHQLSLYVLGTSDRILLDFFRIPTAQIGLYSQGYGLGSYGSLIINGVFQSLARPLQEGLRSDEYEKIVKTRKLILLVPLIIGLLLAICALWLREGYLFLFRKPELQSGYPIAIIVMCSYMFWSIYNFFTTTLSIQKQTKSIAAISIVAAVVNIVANIILIPRFGIWGAVIVTYFAYVIFGFAGLINKRNRTTLSKYVNITKVCFIFLFFNIFLLAVTFLLKDVFWGYKIIVSLIFLLFGFLAYKKLQTR